MITNVSTAAPGSAAGGVTSHQAPASDRSAIDRAPGSHSPQPESATAGQQRTSWAGWITFLVIAAMATTGWYYRSEWWPRVAPLFTHAAPPAKPPVRVVPIVTAVVKQRDMDLYLNGLGTVTALKTVTIRSRVEGELIKVHFDEGQLVKEGQLLAEIDRRPFEVQRDQAAGQLARDEATLVAAKLTLARYQKLLPTKSVTAQEFDDQLALVQQTEGVIKTSRATVANAELQLTYCNITAPINGRIGLRLVDAGNIVRANDPNGLAVITQLQPIALVFTIPQDEIPRVQKRMREGHQLTVDAYDRDFKTKLASGKLTAIDNQVDSTTGTLKMKAEFDHQDNSLFPNQFVNTRLLVDTRPDAVVVPSAAVQRGPSSTFVYVVKSDETVELRNVEIGPVEGAETSIVSGLQPGEIVATDGIDKLQDKAKVSTKGPEKLSPKGSAADKPETVAKSDVPVRAAVPTEGQKGAR